jgi:hypothetical protein
MATLKALFGTLLTITVTGLNSLASSASRTAGYCLAAIDNSSTLAPDYEITGHITLGATVTAGKAVGLWVFAPRDPDTPTWPDVFSSAYSGTAGAFTCDDEEERDSVMKLIWEGVSDGTGGAILEINVGSLAQFFGGVCPQRFAFFVAHDTTGSALAASGHSLYAKPKFLQSV